MYFYNPSSNVDEKPANLRIYNRKYSSLNGNYQYFLTTYDNPIKIGDYLHDTKDDTYWLVYNSFNVNDVHYEGKMIQCNYLLRWQLSNGNIIERWTNIVSASKYDVGETGNSTIVLSSNNYTILIGYCEEGFELEGKRVFIDMKPINPTKVFKITRSDDVLYNSGNMGMLLSFIADKTEFNPNTDNQELRICSYIDSVSSLPPQQFHTDEMVSMKATILGNRNLKHGFTRTYAVSFTDNDDNHLDWYAVDFYWNIVSDFDVKKSMKENTIDLSVTDENFIGRSFLLQIISNNIKIAEMKINVIEGW